MAAKKLTVKSASAPAARVLHRPNAVVGTGTIGGGAEGCVGVGRGGGSCEGAIGAGLGRGGEGGVAVAASFWSRGEREDDGDEDEAALDISF